MKTLLAGWILVFGFFMIPGSAQAAVKRKVVWLVAPGFWSKPETDLNQHLRELERYLERSIGDPFKIEVKTAEGFALAQYTHLQKELEAKVPDYLIYIQRADFYAFDLRELLLSKTPPAMAVDATVLSSEEIKALLPSWTQVLPKLALLEPLKQAVFLESRLKGPWKEDLSFATNEEFVIYISQTVSEQMNRNFKNKTKFIFFISPEKIRFQNNLFPKGDFENFIARTYFMNVNLDRNTVKEFLGTSGFQYILLPREFRELSKKENLIEGSPYILNSAGILKSFQVLTPVLSDFLKSTVGR